MYRGHLKRERERDLFWNILQKEGKIQQTIAHLFSELRKAANHPILLQRLFNDKFDTICKISHENQIFGAECTLQAVKDYLKKE